MSLIKIFRYLFTGNWKQNLFKVMSKSLLQSHLSNYINQPHTHNIFSLFFNIEAAGQRFKFNKEEKQLSPGCWNNIMIFSLPKTIWLWSDVYIVRIYLYETTSATTFKHRLWVYMNVTCFKQSISSSWYILETFILIILIN